MSSADLIHDTNHLLPGRRTLLLLTVRPPINYGRRRSDFPGRRASDGQEAKEELRTALRQELNFLITGGYHGIARTPDQPTPIFRRSPICVNCGVEHPASCQGCVLLHFVPPARRNDPVPCYAIPLDAQGHTIEDLAYGPELEVEHRVAAWLRARLKELEG
jgi:hypothetical protein